MPRSDHDPGRLRALARSSDTFALDAARLALRSRGGTPENPIDVRSASEIEPCARSTPCPICRAEQRVLDHTVEHHGERRVRAVSTACKHCNYPRTMYFRVGSPLPS